MLTSIQLREEDNTILLNMPFGKPSPSQNFYIKSVEGLGPVPASVATTSWAGQDGGMIQNTRVAERNIVLNVGFKPNYAQNKDLSVLRNEFYQLFPPKAPVYLLFLRDDDIRKTVTIRGVVETHEPLIFDRKGGAQVSVICPNPYFVDYYAGVIDGMTNEPIDTSTFASAPAGFIVDITFERNVGSWYIEAFGQDRMVIKGSYLIGNRTRVSTVSGSKFLNTTRGGTTDIDLKNLSEGSLNMTIDSRTKTFEVGFTTQSTPQAYRLFYTPQHVGV